MVALIIIPDCHECYYSVPIYLLLCLGMVMYMTAVYPTFPYLPC